MRLALGLLSAALISASAHAASLDSVAITGLDSSNAPFSIGFSFDPSMFTTIPGGFALTDPNGTVDSSPDALTVDISDPFIGANRIEVYDASNLDEVFAIDPSVAPGSLTPFVDASGAVTLGTYTGSDLTNCTTAALRRPVVSGGLTSTLALFQMPTLDVPCGASVSLTATGAAPGSVTPEPSSLVLLATGTLGVAGILRRRYLA